MADSVAHPFMHIQITGDNPSAWVFSLVFSAFTICVNTFFSLISWSILSAVSTLGRVFHIYPEICLFTLLAMSSDEGCFARVLFSGFSFLCPMWEFFFLFQHHEDTALFSSSRTTAFTFTENFLICLKLIYASHEVEVKIQFFSPFAYPSTAQFNEKSILSPRSRECSLFHELRNHTFVERLRGSVG